MLFLRILKMVLFLDKQYYFYLPSTLILPSQNTKNILYLQISIFFFKPKNEWAM